MLENILNILSTTDIEALLTIVAPQAVAGWLMVTGAASKIAKHFATQNLEYIGPIIDFLASNDNQAKMTGDESIDSKILAIEKDNEPKNKMLKILKRWY